MHRSTTFSFATLALATCVGGGVGAQAAPGSVRISGGLARGDSVSVSSDRPAYFAVFAIGRGTDANPIQVLSNAGSVSAANLRPEKGMTARSLTVAQLSRFAPAREVVVVALASDVPARLDDFTHEGRWANDLAVADSAISDAQSLVAALASTVYGEDVRYTARVLPVTLPTSKPACATERVTALNVTPPRRGPAPQRLSVSGSQTWLQTLVGSLQASLCPASEDRVADAEPPPTGGKAPPGRFLPPAVPDI